MGANISKIIHTQTGRNVMSVILGVGLASAFRLSCNGKECIIFHAPPLEEIEEKIYKHDDKCIKFKPIPTKCNSDLKIVEFE